MLLVQDVVSDKAFVRNCSMTISSTHGNVTTIYPHHEQLEPLRRRHYLKRSAFNALILAMMSVMWAVTVVERTLSVFAVVPYVRDERVNTFGLIPYWLTAFVGLMQLAIRWCNRKPLGGDDRVVRLLLPLNVGGEEQAAGEDPDRDGAEGTVSSKGN